MTTISNTYNRFNKIEDILDKIDELHELRMRKTSASGFQQVSAHIEKTQVRAMNEIRKLAADLNYSVELTDGADMQSYANAFCDLRSAWSCAMESLYVRTSNYITPTI